MNLARTDDGKPMLYAEYLEKYVIPTERRIEKELAPWSIGLAALERLKGSGVNIYTLFPATFYMPGSVDKAAVMRWRWANGFPLHHPNDLKATDGLETTGNEL